MTDSSRQSVAKGVLQRFLTLFGHVPSPPKKRTPSYFHKYIIYIAVINYIIILLITSKIHEIRRLISTT